MDNQAIPFASALAAIKQGNPYPMLSQRVQFKSETDRSLWHTKADLVLDVLTSVESGNVTIALAEKIKQLFISDPHTKNSQLANRLFMKLLKSCEPNPEKEQSAANFLADVAPNENIPQLLANETARREEVASRVTVMIRESDDQV